VVITTVIVAPIFEEMLFRGLFQSLIGSMLHGLNLRIGPVRVRQTAWVAILLSSAFFAFPHMKSHWPTIFVLGLCLGYAYEKSGSLLRPIFIHMIFNAVNITTALLKAANT
jgi:membrane protease YdiL (CAAX protease family)